MSDEFVVQWEVKLPTRPDFNPNQYRSRDAADIGDTPNTVVFGRAGDDTYQSNITLEAPKDKEEEKETKRKYDVVRIKDPDNEDNHVDVEVLTEWESRTKIAADRTGINERRFKLRFDKQKPSKNVEILERDQTRISNIPD